MALNGLISAEVPLRNYSLTHSLTRVTMPYFIVLAETYEQNYGDLSRLSRSFKVIGTDTDRSATYDFLLAIHSNHGAISYRFRNKRRFRSKIANFSHPVYLTPALREFPLEFCNCGDPLKLGSNTLSDVEKSLTIYAFV